MYRIFDNFLREKNLQLRTDFVGDAKLYAINENVDGNMITVVVSVEKSNIYHQASVRLVENIPYGKEREYALLANQTNLQYKNLCCTIGEDNNFYANSFYVAAEDTFDPSLLVTVASSLINVLKDGLLEEVLRIKYR